MLCMLTQSGFMQVLVHLEEQSPDIGQGVHGLGTKTLEEIGAGDQGHMFGYATDETEELMPLTHVLATRIGYKLTQVGLPNLLRIATSLLPGYGYLQRGAEDHLALAAGQNHISAPDLSAPARRCSRNALLSAAVTSSKCMS